MPIVPIKTMKNALFAHFLKKKWVKVLQIQKLSLPLQSQKRTAKSYTAISF